MLLKESHYDMGWGQRISTWSTTPHPFGVLISQAYLRLFEPSFALRAWQAALTVSVLVLATALYAIGALVRERAGTWGCLLGLSTLTVLAPISRIAGTLEEDLIGAALFALALVLGMVATQDPSKKRLALFGALVAINSIWGLQYAVSLFVVGALWAVLNLTRGEVFGTARRGQMAVAVLGMGCSALLLLLLHGAGVTRYLSYEGIAPSITGVLSGGGAAGLDGYSI